MPATPDAGAAPAVGDRAGDIVSVKIHPAIGVARVGNSADGWFYGPEVPDPPPCRPAPTRTRTAR